MIPKIIHYCWFGGNPINQEAERCIESWKKYCPDYKIKEWNESNFDVTCNTYVQEAYENKKWAFVTDYVRLYAMVTEGGIYMDTDVEVVKSLDPYLKHNAFSGFETDTDISTGILACEKDFPLFCELLRDYDDRHFIKRDGIMDLSTNVYAITHKCMKYGLIRNNTLQSIEKLVIYPKDFFCPKDYSTGELFCTENTVTIHHFAASWLNKYEKKSVEIYQCCLKKYGDKKGHTIGRMLNFPYRVASKFEKFGFIKTLKFVMNKLLKEDVTSISG